MNRHLRLLSIAAVCAVLALSGCSLVQTNPAPAQELTAVPDQAVEETAPRTVVTFDGVEGMTALESLRQDHDVQTSSFENLGEFVEAIDGLAGDGSRFWSFYVNGEQASVGAGKYVVKANDTLEFRLEDMKAYK